MSISSWPSIGRPSVLVDNDAAGMPMYRLQMVVTTKMMFNPMDLRCGCFHSYLRISMISSSTTMFVSTSRPSPQVDWPSRGDQMWKMTKNSRVFMASSISQLERFIWIQSKPWPVRERYSLQGGDNDRGKNQESHCGHYRVDLTSRS